MHSQVRRAILAGLGAVAVSWSLPSVAQQAPTGTVTIVVPFAAGGPTDLLARVLADGLSKDVGVSFVVENVVGGGGSIAAMKVATAKPDGNTLLFTTNALLIDQALARNPQFDVTQDLAVVAIPFEPEMGLFVNIDLPVDSVADLVAYTQTHPGELSYGSGGVGTSIHLAFEQLKAEKDLDIVHVAYGGSAPRLTALISGEIQVTMLDPLYGKPHAEENKIKLLATGGQAPSPFVEGYPTIAKAADLPDYKATYWVGLFLPAEADSSTVQFYRDTLERVLAEPAMAQQLTSMGFPAKLGTAENAAAAISEELVQLRQIIDEAQIEMR